MNLLIKKVFKRFKMKIIAFYLPQFHPIPENDHWWGKGFSEWTNVVKARPRFSGHNQPHIPADLGFYDLRLEETRIAQAELAKQYGISGFCYYHYWFNGKMLLERPFNEVLSSKKPDLPFCLCWANENWSRRWDGRNKDVLIAQNYDKYDAVHHIEWLAKAFADKRYIKINGKPLFLIYKANDIPNIRENVDLWNKTIISKGYPGLYLCYVKKSLNKLNDEEILNLGFDSIVEFQPDPNDFSKLDIYINYFRNNFRVIINKLVDKFQLEQYVSQVPVKYIISYKKIVKKVLCKQTPKYKTFPCVMPGWDNSARRLAPTIIENNDANLYRIWLENAISRASHYDNGEQIVFINAWNEWAEGCHLEPDLRNGSKFLQATKEAIENSSKKKHRLLK